MLWVLKRTVSMRQFFYAPKTYAKNYGLENIHNFTLKIFVYLICVYTTAELILGSGSVIILLFCKIGPKFQVPCVATSALCLDLAHFQ